VVLNYVRSKSFLKEGGRITGAVVQDIETGHEMTVRAKAVINATGIFVDDLRQEDDPAIPKLLSVSRGTHIVVAARVLAGETAIMVPKTPDGRVIFAIPWSGRVVIGTTDLAASKVEMEPGHQESEIEYLMETINPYLAKPIERSDILSVFSGLRPLVTGKSATTSKLSREHHIDTSPTGLITVAGGKWTTYRRMAEDVLNFAIKHGMLPKLPCKTDGVKVHGAPASGAPTAGPLFRYGTDADEILRLRQSDPALAAKIVAELPFTFAEVIYAVRHEMARTVEDVLSRRMRALLIDAKAASRAAPAVASAMARELGAPAEWEQQQVAAFQHLASTFYLP
jgi:glycerol-3-phosphate dehydrogenase